jgi:hypothetical protein
MNLPAEGGVEPRKNTAVKPRICLVQSPLSR